VKVLAATLSFKKTIINMKNILQIQLFKKGLR
jgi:hypothetical protein